MELFEKATKSKLRFETRQGNLTTEDLWDLSLTSLDNIAKAVNKLLKEEVEESFIPNKVTRVSTNGIKLDVLKHIIGVKVEEAEATKARTEKQAMLSRLKELAANKATEELASKGLEEIRKQIAEIEASL